MRTDDNCKFKLHKTATRDWYEADMVDARIAELEQELAEARKVNLRQRVNDLCFHAILFGDATYSSINEVFETALKVTLPDRFDKDSYWLYDDTERLVCMMDDLVQICIEQGVGGEG